MQIFENSIIHKPSLGLGEVPQKNWVLSVVGYKQTDRQTNRQTSKVYI